MNKTTSNFNSPKSVISLIDTYVEKSGIDPDLPGAIRLFFGENHADSIHHFPKAAVEMLALLATPEIGHSIQHKLGASTYSTFISLLQSVIKFSETVMEAPSFALIDRNFVEAEEIPEFKLNMLAAKYEKLLNGI